MARLVDIAQAAGVSVGLVSRVLNEDPVARATPETRQRILKAASDLGYRPNYAARALKFSRTDTISLVVPDLTNAMFTELMRGVEDESGALGYTVLLGRSESLTNQDQISQLLDQGRVDGFLLQARDDESTQSLTALIGSSPVVLINGRLDTHPGSVMIDDRAASGTAIDYLLVRGHRDIGLINGLRSSLTARLREEGYRETMQRAGIRPVEAWITHLGYRALDAGPALAQIMQNGDRPSAVVVANVNAALGVLTKARELGLGVPEDLSVIAIHDAWTCDHTWPPLTTVRMPLYDLGARAVRTLHDRLRGSAGVDSVVDTVSPLVVERSSVRSLS